MHPFIPVLSPSFLYHPYIPSFKSKDFSFTCIHVHVHCIYLYAQSRKGECTTNKIYVRILTQQDLSASSYAHLYWCRCHWKETAVQHRLGWGLSTNPTAVELVGYLRQEGSSRSGVEYTGVSGVLGGDWGVWRRLEKDVQVLSEHIYIHVHMHVYTYTYNTFSGKMSAVFRGM